MTGRSLRVLLLAVIVAGCSVGTAAEPPRTAAPVAVADQASKPAPTITATVPPEAIPAEPSVPRPVAPPTPAPTPTPAPAAFALNLYEEGDFVPQHTFEWCVGASVQMAWNMVQPETRSSYEDQQALWEYARSRSSNSFNGANPLGWALTLEQVGLGDYQVVSIPDYAQALRTAAAAIRETERPVGLVMWRGRHAWVMSGFESIGDPAMHDGFSVTGIRVVDPLYPYGSGIWGPSPQPNTLLSPDELAKQFVIREPRRWSSNLGAGYLLVLPVAEA